MNAKRRTLAVLAAVIAVLGLALWALNRSTAAEEAASSAAADGTIPLCSFSTADLSRITYTYNGQTLTLDDADGSWTLAEDPDYHLDESACNTMVTALSSLHAKRQLDAQAGEDYGFDAPELTVTVTAAGQTTTLTFGSSNPVTGDRYVQKDGDTALYTVDASRTACFACDKAGLFGSFSPAGFAASDVEQVAYTLASGEKVSLTAGSELAGDGDEADSASYETTPALRPCWSWTPSRAAPCLPACRKAGAMNNGCGQGSGREKPQIPLAKFLTICYTRNCS